MGFFKDGFNEKITFAIVLVVVLAVLFIYTGQKEKPAATAENNAEPASAESAGSPEISAMEKILEDRISANLESIKGVGKAKVLVTISAGMKKEFASNESVTKKNSKQTDKDGGIQETEELTQSKELVLANSSPVLVQEKKPEVAGVLVIAQGASDPKIKEQIFEAVRTLLNIQPSKISVMPLGGV